MLLGTIAAIDAHEFHFNMLNWNPTLLAKSPPDGSDETVLLLPDAAIAAHACRSSTSSALDFVISSPTHSVPGSLPI
jgi:hypothetical protein